MRKSHIALATVLLAVVAVSAAAAGGRLDDGLLDPAWFGAGEIEFRDAEHFDYLWVSEGFSIEGKTLHLADWEEPQFLGKERDSKDAARAYEMTDDMPTWLRGGLSTALGEVVELSREEGDLRVEGRFVDCNAGNKLAKALVGFGAGSAAATWDIRFVDVASGETVAAVHHRSLSGTTLSEIDDKVIKWIDEDLGPALRTGLGTIYSRAKKARN